MRVFVVYHDNRLSFLTSFCCHLVSVIWGKLKAHLTCVLLQCPEPIWASPTNRGQSPGVCALALKLPMTWERHLAALYLACLKYKKGVSSYPLPELFAGEDLRCAPKETQKRVGVLCPVLGVALNSPLLSLYLSMLCPARELWFL